MDGTQFFRASASWFRRVEVVDDNPVPRRRAERQRQHRQHRTPDQMGLHPLRSRRIRRTHRRPTMPHGANVGSRPVFCSRILDSRHFSVDCGLDTKKFALGTQLLAAKCHNSTCHCVNAPPHTTAIVKPAVSDSVRRTSNYTRSINRAFPLFTSYNTQKRPARGKPLSHYLKTTYADLCLFSPALVARYAGAFDCRGETHSQLGNKRVVEARARGVGMKAQRPTGGGSLF